VIELSIDCNLVLHGVCRDHEVSRRCYAESSQAEGRAPRYCVGQTYTSAHRLVRIHSSTTHLNA